jgi:hypothetical protein
VNHLTPRFRVGRHLRFRLSDVERWEQERIDTEARGR